MLCLNNTLDNSLESAKEMFPFINLPSHSLRSKGRVNVYPQLKLCAASLEDMRSSKSIKDFNPDHFVKSFKTTTAGVPSTNLIEETDLEKIRWHLAKEAKKGLDIILSLDKTSFVLVFDAPSIPPKDIDITFLDERTIQFQLEDNHQEILPGGKRLLVGRKHCFISKSSRTISLPFCPVESAKNYSKSFIYYNNGTVMVRLTPQQAEKRVASKNCYVSLEDHCSI